MYRSIKYIVNKHFFYACNFYDYYMQYALGYNLNTYGGSPAGITEIITEPGMPYNPYSNNEYIIEIEGTINYFGLPTTY